MSVVSFFSTEVINRNLLVQTRQYLVRLRASRRKLVKRRLISDTWRDNSQVTNSEEREDKSVSIWSMYETKVDRNIFEDYPFHFAGK